LDAWLEHLHPDAEYDATAAIGPFAGMYYGRPAIRSFLAEYFESWDYARMVPEDFIEVGDDVVVVSLHLQLRGKGSGLEVDARTTNVWFMRDGKAARMAVYNDIAEALEAAELSK
jgi:ketosteroid isomerase-like protein